jgi:hypothetical protein
MNPTTTLNLMRLARLHRVAPCGRTANAHRIDSSYRARFRSEHFVHTPFSMWHRWLIRVLLLPLFLSLLLPLMNGCSTSPECLFAPLPSCFSNDDVDVEAEAETTATTVNEHADEIDASVAAIRTTLTGLDPSVQTTVNEHLDDITISTDLMRDEVATRADGFHIRTDDLTNSISSSTAFIREEVAGLDAIRDTVNDHLDNIDDSTGLIDERILDDCDLTTDGANCDQIGN